MRLVSFGSNGILRPGILVRELVIDASEAARAADLAGGDKLTSRAILELEPKARARLGEAAQSLAAEPGPGVHFSNEVHLGPPVPDPDKIVCLGLNYRDHADEAGLSTPVVPMLFAKFRNSLVGPFDPIVLPTLSTEVDYEAELAVVIGATCKHVTPERALDFVAGVMAFNDVSARDLQMQTSQFTGGKAIDTFGPSGPALVTLDEISDIQALRLATRVNGQTLQNGSTANMIFSVAEIVSYLSRLMTLVPGDVIATGTPAGVGFTRHPPVYLTKGDVVEVEVERVGTLRNPVVGPQLPD